jgi:hypothetical protein
VQDAANLVIQRGSDLVSGCLRPQGLKQAAERGFSAGESGAGAEARRWFGGNCGPTEVVPCYRTRESFKATGDLRGSVGIRDGAPPPRSNFNHSKYNNTAIR